MKILLAGDSHGDSRYIKSLLAVARENQCRLIFVLGDFGYWEHQGDGIIYLDVINTFARDYNIDIYFLDGNHDKLSLLLENYQTKNSEGFIIVRDRIFYSPRGHRWIWNDKKFISLGGAYSVDKAYRLHLEKKHAEDIANKNTYRSKELQKSIDTSGLFWFPEEEMSDQDMSEILLNTDPVDIMLAHDKPIGSSMPEGSNREDILECRPNQQRLQLAARTLKPLLFFHGHLHYPYSSWVRIEDGYEMLVRGLDSDPKSRHSRHPRNSWHILDLLESLHALTRSSQID